MAKFESFYLKHYKKFFIIPVVIVFLAIGVILVNYIKTGEIVGKDVSLKGGLTLTFYTGKEIGDLESSLAKNFEGDFKVKRLAEFGTGKQIGIIIEATDVKENELKKFLEEKFETKLTEKNYSVEFIGSTLGKAFYSQMKIAIILAFVFMAIVVFITYKTPVPSFAVVFAALSDIICTIAILDLSKIKLSTAGIAALLLLIGYSVDTDILLTTRIIKRKGEERLFERLVASAKTGLTMTFTTLAVAIVGLLVSASLVLKEIFLIIAIGLSVDIIMTYFMNAGLLIWYARRKNVY